MRGFNFKKSVQALNLLAIKSGGRINKMKALKLIWLADRLHTRKYGRSITGDDYFALPKGPVPSATRDILEANDHLGDIAMDYASEYISQDTHDKFYYRSLTEANQNVFSQTDLDVLALVFDTFGTVGHFELSELSHHFPEWVRFKSALETGLSSRFRILQSDFFGESDIHYDIFNESPEDLSIVKEIYNEREDILSIL